MSSLTIILDVSILVFCLAAGIYLTKRRRYIGGILFLSIVFRGGISAILQTGLQYNFVWDSLKYEQDAWLLAKSWKIQPLFELDQSTGYDLPNIYSYFMASVFYIFGRDSYLLNLLNGALMALSTYVLLPVLRQIRPNPAAAVRPAEIFFVLGASIYPSLTVWSATNTKDPATLFCAALALNGALNTKRNLGVSILLGLVGMIGVYFFRPYWAYTLGLGFGLGALYFWVTKKSHLRFSPKILALIMAVAPFVGFYFAPDLWQQLTMSLKENRLAFANFMLDDSAKSAFLLHFDFESPLRFIYFTTLAVGHYFLAPFPWDIQNWTQALALIETSLVVVIMIRTYLNLNRSQSLSFATSTLTSILGVLVVVQSLVISNMGTIFRHRSLAILILLMFASWPANSKAPSRRESHEAN